MCSRWLIASQRAGRLLRSQIKWHYSQDCVPIFYSHDLTQIRCFPITMSNKKLHTVRHFSTPESQEKVVQYQILGHVSDLCVISKERKPNRRLDCFLFFFLWKGAENQAKVERAKHDWKVFQQAEAAQVEKWIWHLLLLTLCTFWQSRLFILVTKKSVIL